jgi:hypothetical protein
MQGADHARPLLHRRRFLAAIGVGLPAALALGACAGSRSGATTGQADDAPAPAPPPPTATPEPFVLPAGEDTVLLMAGTPYETPLYVFGSGRPGPIALALGGVHGNEPGGWLAAERVAAQVRPDVGGLLVAPHVNKVAMGLFQRTTDEIGDVNRAYPGRPDGTPAEQIAYQVVQAVRDFHVGLVVDMHESWAFYKDRPQNGTAFLGQTVATNSPEPGPSIARAAVAAVNQRIQSPVEEFFFRDRFGSNFAAAPGVPEGPSPAGAAAPNAAGPGGVSRSSLGLSTYVPGVIAILVEMGQQQALERRIALHVDMFQELLRRQGVLSA